MRQQRLIFLVAISCSLQAFASPGDLLLANEGSVLRGEPTPNAPAIRKTEPNEILLQLPKPTDNGYILVKLNNGQSAWITEKSTHKAFITNSETKDEQHAKSR